MKNNYRVLGTITLFVIISIIYILFILLNVESISLFLFLTIGSVSILSTSTIYTIVQSKTNQDMKLKDSKFNLKKKSLKRKSLDLVEDYFGAMPIIDEYADSNTSYENVLTIDDYIFSMISQEVLDKIDLLGLSKMDKIFFIRDMLYFNSEERKNLIENMLKSRDNSNRQIIYTPPTNGMENNIRVYVRSLVEPGEKTRIITIETTELINTIKERVGILFNYGLEDFHLSSGGILLDENSFIKDYDIDDYDEIALIPSKKNPN